MEFKQIQELIKTINKSNISELSIQDGEFQITINQGAEGESETSQQHQMQMHMMMPMHQMQMPMQQQMPAMQGGHMPQAIPAPPTPASPADAGGAGAATGGGKGTQIKSPM